MRAPRPLHQFILILVAPGFPTPAVGVFSLQNVLQAHERRVHGADARFEIVD
ncbi:hypothetical protein K402DRAFT_397468 [Aulographum hederae CBS 113979]|uniref:Uncharacterized protein n=1 Tax=Aulographum hederae CBS 113979 TaxID=1176131 RepID=A0A6G1GP24_9PEZI|nr:hypothetical protein K402DRAFT_397468 [Aulographum hederae CBS 113979]